MSVLFIYMAVNISTTVLVPEDVSYILADKPYFFVDNLCSDISKFWTVKDCYIIHTNTYLSGMPWYYGKETVKAHSFRVAIPYLCHMCSYELKGAFYFGKIFWGLSSPMPGARSQTPTPPFRVIIWHCAAGCGS